MSRILRLPSRCFASQTNLNLNCPHQPKEPANVKPFTKLPKLTSSNFEKRFAKGGDFFNLHTTDVFKRLQLEYGDIFMKEGSAGNKDVLVIFKPEDFVTVFRNEGLWPFRDGLNCLAHHRKVCRPDLYGKDGGLAVAQYEAWHRVRSAVNPAMLNPNGVKVYIPAIDQVAKEFVGLIRQKRDAKSLEVGEDFYMNIKQWTLESVGFIGLNTRLGCLEDNKHPEAEILIKNVMEFFDMSYDLDLRPSTWKIKPTPEFIKLMESLDLVSEISDKFVEKAITDIQQQPSKSADDMSVLEKLIKIDKQTAKIMALEMLFAGVDTTSIAFTSILLSLAKNPDKQSKLREEVMAMKEPLTRESLNSAPYLRACIKESIRMYPVTFGNGRAVVRDVVIGGYQIPKDTMTLMVFQPLYRDEKYYKNPDQFIPERWIRESDLYQGQQDPFVFLPFGFGPRACVGKRISNMELEIGTINIVKNFLVEFNYPLENAFASRLLNVPIIPLKFKFTDI